MNRIVEHNYGADADNNRGITKVYYELDEEDIPEIKSQIIEYLESTEKLPDSEFTVYLIDPVTEKDVILDINPFEYISKDKCQEIINNFKKE